MLGFFDSQKGMTKLLKHSYTFFLLITQIFLYFCCCMDKNNKIVLSLTNTNSTNDSSLILFKSYGANGSTTAAELRIVVNASDFTDYSELQIWYDSGSINSYNGVTSITDFVTRLNADFQEAGQGIFSYQTITPTQWHIKVATTKWTFQWYYSSLPLIVLLSKFTATGNTVLIGSTVSPTMETGDLTYAEITSELQSQPYKITFASVYASSVAQANSVWTVNNRQITGYSYKNYNHPAISPQAYQFVTENIPIGLDTNSSNTLAYTVKGGETVKVFLYYDFINPIQQINPQLIIEQPIKVIQNKTDYTMDNPLTGLVNRPSFSSKMNIKDVVKPFTNPQRKISDYEVYSGFSGYEFKSENEDQENE